MSLVIRANCHVENEAGVDYLLPFDLPVTFG